jgi:5-methylcytosine-specific restriction endonuclease McrA
MVALLLPGKPKEKYSDYLKSDHWKSVKKAKQRLVPKRCAICASCKDIHLHHLFYRGRYEEETSDLRWLCAKCHHLAHKLINKGVIKPKPGKEQNHHSLFALTKHHVKKRRGMMGRNMFKNAK